MRNEVHVVAGPGTLTLAAARKAMEAAKAARPRDMTSVYSDANRERYLGHFGPGPRKSLRSSVRAKGKKGRAAKTEARKKR
jgi:hypothetical protein